ncbi:LSU ribosomal protein L7/L12 (P1/P2) [Liberibacter crescens BT-1]|uniref:Large ribosomal subunit protein bL12 n=1 Tax=Liberibacter crescens (strain BT-1) TaxID=1215343 RepID=L0EV47_LIBCB|nr:50S ribosomal protein L7/L12 [Liberibacter crescens]AGA64837.1 LSU ribosomal protein L7/L12 (P1/P2) [Liberibacter crescens BT-1]AMC12890.1 50S ribosomal protein L7 [Liberibacter crescens]
MPDIESIVEQLSSLTLLQASELSKRLEEHWGVSAAAPVSVASVGGVSSVAEVEKTEFDVILVGFDQQSKINVIKEVRSITGLGLKEAKDLVEGFPKPIKEAVSKGEAKDIEEKLKSAGAKVEVR